MANHDVALAAYRKAGKRGLTDDEALAAELLHQNSWRPTRIKLIKEGKIRLSDEKRVTRSGWDAAVYVVNK